MTYALMMFWKYFAIKSQLACFIRVVELGNYTFDLCFSRGLAVCWVFALLRVPNRHCFLSNIMNVSRDRELSFNKYILLACSDHSLLLLCNPMIFNWSSLLLFQNPDLSMFTNLTEVLFSKTRGMVENVLLLDEGGWKIREEENKPTSSTWSSGADDCQPVSNPGWCQWEVRLTTVSQSVIQVGVSEQWDWRLSASQ